MIIKSLPALIIALLSFSAIDCQSKQDYHWFFGSDQNPELEGSQGFRFDFNMRPFTPKINSNGLEFDQNNASISDQDGNLLFYTNGCAIANKNHEIMENGDSINYNLYFEVFVLGDCGLGYRGHQDVLILNDPANIDGYYLIHKPREYDPSLSPSRRMRDLNYTYIDMSNELGVVRDKNVVFDSKTYLWSYLTAIKHTNRKDWWIVQPKDFENINYIYLLDGSGISLYDSTQLGNKPYGPNSGASGQAKFSPDGTMYAFYNYYDGLYLYDFDRATASFSNFRVLETPPTEELIFGGLEFSPNSEYLYLTNRDTLFQVDLSYNNLKDGLEVIDTYDGVQDPFSTTFAFCALGPDCKIYIRTTNGTRSFHIINRPNEKGLACDFVERGLRLPEISSTGSFPNNPRFRVDEDAPCDPTISTFLGPDIMLRREIQINPNPVSSILTVHLPKGIKGKLEIVNALGHSVLQSMYVDGLTDLKTVDVSALPSGYYLIRIDPQEKTQYFYDAKFIKE